MLFILTGPSGIGKSHLSNELASDGFEIISRVSTRAPRPNDNSTDMKHVSLDEYKEMESKGEFLVSEEFGGNWYGFLKSELLNNAEKPKAVVTWPEIVELFVERMENVIPVYLDISDENIEVLIQRMKERGDDEESIKKRVELTKSARNYLETKKEMFQEYGKVFDIVDNTTLYDEVIPWILNKTK